MVIFVLGKIRTPLIPEFYSGDIERRKIRLFTAACYRLIPDHPGGPITADVVERYADGCATEGELAGAGIDWWFKGRMDDGSFAFSNVDDPKKTLMAHLLRDIFGPLLFRHVAVQPSWLTGDVITLARSIYEDRRFEDLPILADALEESGCTDPDILGHLRSPGPHVRGCWVVDLL
jgi:hypothetical protein